MYYFSDDYEQGRSKFLQVCKNNNLIVESHINPCIKSLKGENLAMDMVWCGNKQATKLLLVTSGTHGLEASTGSATIVQWLDQKNYLTLEKDCAVLFVHTINPYGWAYNSRTNEDNIDLNRNFLSHEKPYPINVKYKELIDELITDKLNSKALKLSIDKFHEYSRVNGFFAAAQAITGGQYTDASGIGYGGVQASWSNLTLKNIIQEKLKKIKKVIHIDWHTGIGEYGKPFFISTDKTESPEYKLACRWWGDCIHNDDVFEEGSPNYNGLLCQGLKKEIQQINQAEVTSVAIELGTYSLDSMLQALLIDRWLRFSDDHLDENNTKIQTFRLVERFYPSQPEWRQNVLIQSAKIFKQALIGLKNWNNCL